MSAKKVIYEGGRLELWAEPYTRRKGAEEPVFSRESDVIKNQSAQLQTSRDEVTSIKVKEQYVVGPSVTVLFCQCLWETAFHLAQAGLKLLL